MSDSVPRTGFDWDRVTALSALIVSFVAVGVAAYTAQLQRQQVRAQVWPRLVFYNAGSLAEFHVANKGNGPAIVRSVRVLVDGKPATNWNQVYRQLGLPADADLPYSTVNGAVLAPGDDFMYHRPLDKAQFAVLRDLGQKRWSLQACYCSALDECWIAQAHPRTAADVSREVSSCPTPDPAREFEN
ncbi:hypothetical protein [Noviluteimonas gilva]|uniref:Uncharacterized protein n=1 Tax=Noviluteimonas gilva TaxID=2682097 RepID=A0A7C9LGH6_9GAMM|nr:hypothetical protein [Lysobacter gilvus]MUV13981.1 hypothetical protein [Lysobacter gilvus]